MSFEEFLEHPVIQHLDSSMSGWPRGYEYMSAVAPFSMLIPEIIESGDPNTIEDEDSSTFLMLLASRALTAVNFSVRSQYQRAVDVVGSYHISSNGIPKLLDLAMSPRQVSRACPSWKSHFVTRLPNLKKWQSMASTTCKALNKQASSPSMMKA